MKRRLTLSRETLTELTARDLVTVQGGAYALSDRYGRCTLDRSYLPCTINCPMTFNTCDACAG